MHTRTLLILIKVESSIPELQFIISQYCCSHQSSPKTDSRIWNRWVQDGNTESCAGSQWPHTTISQEDRHVTCMTLMDLAAKSQARNQELGLFARQVSERTILQYLLQHGLSAWRPWLRLPLTLHHRQKHLQWCDQ
ncbi:HTH_Tnp_Tc3_2 domain-containing protein [Trichonephila clavipes]|nr:HTH_Tnp_Tc3_2 domain-containing protein [Trichonephila clavipes]